MRPSVLLITAFYVCVTLFARGAYNDNAKSTHYTTSEISLPVATTRISNISCANTDDVLRHDLGILTVSRREYDIEGEGWKTSVELLNVFDPAQPAARALEQFYEAVLEQIQSLSGNTPAGRLCLSAGGMCIGIRCTGGRLPWELVRVVVKAMLEATQQGFAGEFRSNWQHFESGILIQVGLVIIDDTVKRIMSGNALVSA